MIDGVRSRVRRAIGSALRLRAPRRTALAVARDRRPPSPGAFARHGENSWLVPPIRLRGARGIELGRDVVVLDTAGIEVDDEHGARLVIGDRVRFGKGLEIVCGQRVEIGAGVSGSDNVAITDLWCDPQQVSGSPPGAPVVIEPGAYLGYGCTVTPGVRVGAGAFVGEGSVVVCDVAPHSVVYGNPAREIRRLDDGGWHGPRLP